MTTMTHDFRLSFEQNTLKNAERFVAAGEPLRPDLLSQVKTVIRQNTIMISQYQDEITALKADLENNLRTTRANKVREWNGARATLHENEIAPREMRIAAREAQNRRLQVCLDFSQKESQRREREQRDKQAKQYPERVKHLLQQATGTNKDLIKKIHSLAKVLENQSLFEAVSKLVSIPQDVKRLEGDKLILESHGVTCDAIPDKLYEASKEMKALHEIVEAIVGRSYQVKRRQSTTKRLELSKVREMQRENAARLKEGIQ